MSKTVSIDQLANEIEKDLTLYHKSIVEGINTEAKKSMSDLVKRTKATAPVGHRKKHYRDNITSKKLSETDRGVTYVWYVKGSDYRLTHLLENGHALRNGGRVEGTHFVEKASDPILAEFKEKIEAIIKNG